jgi:hypothetical protein
MRAQTVENLSALMMQHYRSKFADEKYTCTSPSGKARTVASEIPTRASVDAREERLKGKQS